MKNEFSEKLNGVSTTAISDSLDMIGINGGLKSIHPISQGLSVVGPAYTLQYEETREGEQAPAGDFIDEVPEGCVVVISTNNQTNCTVWGDILTFVAQKKGIKGTVIDGLCRDAKKIRELNYPMFSKGVYMKSGKNRVKLIAKQVPVQINGTTVYPNDIVCADDNGVIVIPKNNLTEITKSAIAVEEMEQKILSELTNGAPLKVTREKYNYNNYSLNKK